VPVPDDRSETTLAVTEAEWDLMLTVDLRAGFLLGQAAGRAYEGTQHQRENAFHNFAACPYAA
jgi:hypothetical protein